MDSIRVSIPSVNLAIPPSPLTFFGEASFLEVEHLIYYVVSVP